MIEYRFKVGDKIDYSLFEALKKERDNQEIGYFKLPYDSKELIENLANIKSKKIVSDSKTIVIIGVGGSSLGIKAIYSILKPFSKHLKELIFLENPAPIDITTKLKKIDKNKAIFIIISKSGNTIETLSIFKVILKYFNFDLNRDSNRLIVISDKGSNLDKFANENKISIFYIPKNVGGRFSVLSAVGIVPLELAGFNTKNLLIGAKEFLDRFFNKKENHILKKATFLIKNIDIINTNILFAYGNCFEEFTKWYIQLWAESLGKINKEGKRVGLTPISLIGSIDQHSFLQLIVDGPRDKSVTFLKVLNFKQNIKIPNINLDFLDESNFVNGHTLNTLLNMECDATFEALEHSKIPVDMIILDEISAYNIGELIIYYELLTSLVGVGLKINTYNQPGVELGKKILKDKFIKGQLN